MGFEHRRWRRPPTGRRMLGKGQRDPLEARPRGRSYRVCLRTGDQSNACEGGKGRWGRSIEMILTMYPERNYRRQAVTSLPGCDFILDTFGNWISASSAHNSPHTEITPESLRKYSNWRGIINTLKMPIQYKEKCQALRCWQWPWIDLFSIGSQMPCELKF